jgi:branched-chain amino acid transport system ATP-binding protein
MTAPILELQAVSKEFGGIHALNAVSFALKEGQIVAVIGPNGAGKTTLINVITGVHRVSSGQVAFRGEDVTGQRPFQAARRGLARTFQIVQPFPRMSVLENVAAGALFGGAHARMSEAMEAAREQLAFTGLTAFTDRPASALTLAGRKRLELAKSLAMRPQLLMLDEVNSGLNSSEIDGALALIRSIAGRGITILIIEHVMKVIFSLAERVLVLHHGELIADGSPGEIAKDQRVIEAYLGEKFARRSPPPFLPPSQVGLARLAQHSAEPGQARVPPGEG